MINRPQFSKKATRDIYYRVGNIYGAGHCWHCGKKLVFKNRLYGKQGAWHIDHFPVVYRDIENQCCCGVTDPKCLTNLVPSCVACNISHNNEQRLFLCCRRSQCKCEGNCVCWTIFKILAILAALLLAWLLVKSYIENKS